MDFMSPNAAPQVYIIHRRDEFRASKIMQSRALANPKIEVLWSTVTEEAFGNEKGFLGGLTIRDLKTDEVHAPRPASSCQPDSSTLISAMLMLSAADDNH